METATALRSSFSTCIRPSERTDIGRCRKGSVAFATVSNKQRFPSFSHPRTGLRNVSFQSQKKRNALKASLSSDSDSGGGSDAPIAPLELESPIGQLLSQILVSHPHLVPAAVEQQLEQLQTDRDAQKQNQQPSAQTTDLVLYKRIAEVKANETRKALEEILYALVVQKFMDAKISLIPSITPKPSAPIKPIDTWPSQDEKLQLLHSPEALEMIQNHLSLILGHRGASDSTSIAEIDKLKVGQVYAASVMYGYFLKRVDQRFQLEKTTKVLPEGEGGDSGDAQVPNVHPEVSSWSSEVPNSGGAFGQVKPSRLRNYVMLFDAESLQRYATIRSKEAVSIIEKHTEALFGRPTADSSKDEVIKISFGGLRRLILEAVTFGSFLWDVESYVDSRYHFVAN